MLPQGLKIMMLENLNSAVGKHDHIMIKAINLSNLNGVRHAFFSRDGGVSEGIYESLNCGYGSGDDRKRVRANREAAMAMLGSSADELVTLQQCHSTKAVIVDAPWTLEKRPIGDAMATNVSGIALGIMTADCGPVLFADNVSGVVGAAHAGWKGSINGVLNATIKAMEALGAKRKNISAALGPCIRQASYEVGEDFKKKFLNADINYGMFFNPGFGEARAMFDLAGFIINQLQQLEIGSAEDIGIDTYPSAGGFFSYRRSTHLGEKDYGRGLSVIMLGS